MQPKNDADGTTNGTSCCSICGDNAACGMNFGCQSCESCKAFFRRCCAFKAGGQQQLVCPFSGQCKITKASRKACPACRLTKCVQMGMRKEMVDVWKKQWTARKEQKVETKPKTIRRRRRPINGRNEEQERQTSTNDEGEKIRNKKDSKSCSSPAASGKPRQEFDGSKEYESRSCVCKCTCGAAKKRRNKVVEQGTQTEEAAGSTMCPLTSQEQSLLDELVRANVILDMPLRVPSQFLPFNLTIIDALRVSELAMRRMVAMFKQLDAFRSLEQRDQVTLLRGSLVELLILRGAMAFDPGSEEWRAAILSAGGDKPHPFCLNLNVLPSEERHSIEHKRFLMTFDERWRTNRDVMLILHAIVLFKPPSEPLVCKQLVEESQQKYRTLLRRYLLIETGGVTPTAESAFAHLMGKIDDLHKLNVSFQWLYNRLNIGELKPLLKELFTTINAGQPEI